MKERGHRPHGRFLPAAAVLLVTAALIGWWLHGEDAAAQSAGTSVAPTQRLAAAPAVGAAVGASAQPPGLIPAPPLSEVERQTRRTLLGERLARSREALDTYKLAARYPHESRPAREHPDQLRPFDPIESDQPLKTQGGSPLQGFRLRTTQERVFLSGSEHSRVTLSLVDEQGQRLPLSIRRAVLREVPAPGATSRTVDLPIFVNDEGGAGDTQAQDGIYTGWIEPRAQGFAEVSGLLRLELNLEYANQPGFLYFDFIYSPETAARWLPGVRDAVVNGSLEFKLQAEVLIAGRYVVSARIDDASGRTVALAMFNDELARGARDVRLPVFGKLLHDEAVVFPLRLRDVDAFLLKADVYPDRVMLPRLVGTVHTSQRYSLSDFTQAEWQSSERNRYLDELGSDVDRAQRELDALGP